MEALVVFPASEMATPLEGAYTVRVEQRASAARRELTERRFDQAPATRRGRLVGWVRTAQLSGRGLVSSSVIPLDECVVLSGDASVQNAIGLVAQTGLVFLAGSGGISQFVVPSDLDRHAVRSYLYVILSEIEFRLAELTRRWVPEQKIIERFEEDQRERYELARRKGRETHAVEYLYLSSYVSIIKSTPELALLIGWDTARRRKGITDLNELRTCVAHPSKSLTGQFDAFEIARRALLAEEVLRQVSSINK